MMIFFIVRSRLIDIHNVTDESVWASIHTINNFLSRDVTASCILIKSYCRAFDDFDESTGISCECGFWSSLLNIRWWSIHLSYGIFSYCCGVSHYNQAIASKIFSLQSTPDVPVIIVSLLKYHTLHVSMNGVLPRDSWSTRESHLPSTFPVRTSLARLLLSLMTWPNYCISLDLMVRIMPGLSCNHFNSLLSFFSKGYFQFYWFKNQEL